MAHTEEIRKVAMVGDYVPRKCGIATFTHNVYESLAAQYPGTECLVAAVNDVPEGYGYPKEVRFEWPEGDLPAYRLAAHFRISTVSMPCVCSTNSGSSAGRQGATSWRGARSADAGGYGAAHGALRPAAQLSEGLGAAHRTFRAGHRDVRARQSVPARPSTAFPSRRSTWFLTDSGHAFC